MPKVVRMLVRKTCHSSVLCSSIFVWFVLGLELGVKADLTQWKSFIGTAVVSSSSRSFARRREVEVRLPCAGGGLLFCQEREREKRAYRRKHAHL